MTFRNNEQDAGGQAQKIFSTFAQSAENEEAARTIAASHAENMQKSQDPSERAVGEKLASLVSSLEL